MPESGGGNFFTQKLGPLALWVWAVIALVILLGVMYWKKIGPFAAGGGSSSAGSAGSFQSAPPGSDSLPGMLGNQGADLSTLSRDKGNPSPPIPTVVTSLGGGNPNWQDWLQGIPTLAASNQSSPRGGSWMQADPAHATNPMILSPLAPAPIIQAPK
jgi:hypothetical protein